jgi:hypothetical protein
MRPISESDLYPHTVTPKLTDPDEAKKYADDRRRLLSIGPFVRKEFTREGLNQFLE